MSGNSPRIKDIAEKAGVSVGTVDRVLHNRGEVKPETKDKILEIAKKLKYKPNLAARALKSRKTYNITVLIPNSMGDNNFWDLHPQGILKATETVHPFNVSLKFHHFDMHNGEDFKIQAKRVLGENPDGVIFAPILKKESYKFCRNMDLKKVPYIFIDTFINDTNALSFIGEDAFQSGRVAASIIDIAIDPNKDILIVNIAKDLENTQHLNSRNQGFVSYFMDAGRNNGLKITAEISSTNEIEIKSVMDRVFKNNPNIGAVMVSSSKTYAIAKYLKNEHKRNLFVVGYEVFGKNISYLKERHIQFLIGQRPVEQGEKALRKMIDYLTLNQIPEKIEFQSIDIVNIENLSLL